MKQGRPAIRFQLAPQVTGALQQGRVMPALGVHHAEDPGFTRVRGERPRDRKPVDADDAPPAHGQLPARHAADRASPDDHDIGLNDSHCVSRPSPVGDTMTTVVLAPLTRLTGEHDPHRQGASPQERHGYHHPRSDRIVVGRADGHRAGTADPPHAPRAVLAPGIRGLFHDLAHRIPAVDRLRSDGRDPGPGHPQRRRPARRIDRGHRGCPAAPTIPARASP